MDGARSTIILACVSIYLVACVWIGLWAMKRTRSVRDFFVAGRDLGVLVTGVAIFSSTMSGFGFVGGPGLVYRMGMSSIWIVLTTAISYAIADFAVAKRLRVLAGIFDTVSLPDAVGVRYGSETTRFLTALAILLGILGYLATQILAMGTVLQSILGRTATFEGIGLITCVAISCSVMIFYSVTGGIVASVYTDLVQGTIMVVAGVLVFVGTLSVFEGGPGAAIRALVLDDPQAMSPWGTLGMIGCLSWFFMFSLGTAGQPHLITKAMMIQRLRQYRWIPLITVGGYTITALLWISIGLVMRALVVSGKHPELPFADAAAPEFLQHYAHPLLAGIVFAALFAAIMSTGDAFLNIGTAALTHDIPRVLLGRTVANELMWARICTALLAVVGALFALYSHFVNARLVALLGAFGWGTFGAALVPAVAIGFNWKRATATAANVAIIASLVINFSVEIFDIALPHGIHGGTLSLIVSTILFFGVTYATEPRALDPRVAAAMDL